MFSSPLSEQLAQTADIIVRIRQGESLADGLMNRLKSTDRPAVQDMLYRYLRAYAWGDTVLSGFLNKPLKDPYLQALLGLALHQLSQKNCPPHTLVNEAVKTVGAYQGGRFKPLANAVLRNFLRQEANGHMPTLPDEARWGHPAWWITRLQKDHPKHWISILEAGNTHPPMALRINRRRTNRESWLTLARAAGIHATPSGEHGVLLDTPYPVQALPGFFDGEISVQDLGAQRAADLLTLPPGSRALDACAAPGGKAAHWLEAQSLHLTALDISPERCQKIQETLARLGLSAQIKVGDCRKTETWWDGVPYDAILADVPCSASGVVRRHPDSKWLRRPNDIARFAKTQREILLALSSVLRPGGKLLYATCSVFRQENQQQIAHFLADHPSMTLCQEIQLLPNAQHDGFYYALLARHD